MRGRFVSIALGCAAVAAAAVTFAQTDNWYPSRWGAADQRGAANRITPAKVMEAKNLITSGNVYQLGHVYEATMPLFGTRHFSLRIPQTYGPMGTNRMMYHDELVSSEIGQVGTQFDGLGHVGIGDLFYNGNNRADFSRPEGFTKLGIENVGALVTRGVLVDVAALKGVPRLEGGYEITRADLTAALERERVQVRSGDMVLLHTGWGSLWGVDNAAFGAKAPGIGLDAAQYLVDREVVLVGADTWSMEVVPNPNPDLQFPVHQVLLARNGIYIFENLVTDELARDRAYEFAFFFAPLRMKGATGSPGNPLAIR
ncbi:MAG TPA: cyclase family protein [Gammaproteobacteria bacterium]|nr:cyclase family protein [Gammaproteobacteria bacterium]